MSGLKDELLLAMRAYFGDDTRRIEHASKVTAYAEKILEREGGDYPIIMGAAVLHDIGIREAERKYNSSAARYQEMEGPPVARELLKTLRYEDGQIAEICGIIGHHHSPGQINTLNFRVLYDADWLVNLGDDYDIRDRVKLAGIIGKVFLTETGREMAREIYLRD